MEKNDMYLCLASLGVIAVLAGIYDGELIYVAVGWASGILSALGFSRGKGQTT